MTNISPTNRTPLVTFLIVLTLLLGVILAMIASYAMALLISLAELWPVISERFGLTAGTHASADLPR